MNSEPFVFHYTVDNFYFYLEDQNGESKFDLDLKKKWTEAEAHGLFRYILNITGSKILSGQYKFLAQFNPDRAQNRRVPEHINNITQPFDSNRFNFTMISKSEIIFNIDNINSDNIVIINTSPIEQGHCLFIPQRSQCFPQRITEFSLSKSLELLLLSKSPYFRVAFNGLCAYASVNHLHWHLYYLKYKMMLEYITVHSWVGPLFLLTDFPSKGFCLKLSNCQNINNFVTWAFLVVKYLQDREIAHNVFITRAKDSDEEKEYKDVRLYIWARKPFKGIKDTNTFIPAVCELFGHLSIRTEESFQSITENDVTKVLTEETEGTFLYIKNDLQKFIQNQVMETCANFDMKVSDLCNC